MQNTVIVEVSRKVSHPKYGKEIIRTSKFYAHTENPLDIGAQVWIEESKPISKLKRWKVVEVVEKTANK
jgi:small subunit ribosomal protein S17